MVYPYNGIFDKEKWSTDYMLHMDGTLKHAKWEKPVTKELLFCDDIYKKCPG